MTMNYRTLTNVIPGLETSDGAGVKLRRSIGSTQSNRLDPFLMLDEFGTDQPEDYIAGFPPHPHRGFETVTYMIDGHMRHEDHMGNVGELTEGGVQWMTAGRGVIHSEMPQQEEGLMRGFQLWVNLPAAEKMKPASYRDIPATDIPVAKIDGGRIRVIAGNFATDNGDVVGPIQGLTTAPVFYDVELAAGKTFETALPATHSAFVYSYEGDVSIGNDSEQRVLTTQSAGVLSVGDLLRVTANSESARFVVLAGIPLNEPVVQRGPFVMNTREEIEQAVQDYQNGSLVAA
jgi:redox-sensitive bicupin YhaK (pirin superfamily)